MDNITKRVEEIVSEFSKSAADTGLSGPGYNEHVNNFNVDNWPGKNQSDNKSGGSTQLKQQQEYISPGDLPSGVRDFEFGTGNQTEQYKHMDILPQYQTGNNNPMGMPPSIRRGERFMPASVRKGERFMPASIKRPKDLEQERKKFLEMMRYKNDNSNNRYSVKDRSEESFQRDGELLSSEEVKSYIEQAKNLNSKGTNNNRNGESRGFGE